MTSPRLPQVRGRSWDEIEAITVRLLQRFEPERLTVPGPLDVDRLLEVVVPKHLGVDFSVADFQPPMEAVVTPASEATRAQLLLASTVYEALAHENPRARFTAAHEVGHVVLHVRQLQQQIVSYGGPSLFRKNQIPPYRDPEVQANVFASRLLMPTGAFRLALEQLGPEVVDLALLFNVSERAAAIRADQIGGRR